MKIAVLGAGAMGSLYGGYLSQENEVYLVDVWKDHIEKINEKGLIISEKDKDIALHPKAVTNSKDAGVCDLVIVFVKSTVTGDAVEKNKELFGPNTMVLSLQNGYGNIDEIGRNVNRDNIIAGTTSHGATMLGPGMIRHAGIGDTHIGPVSKVLDERIEGVKKVLEKAGFKTYISENIMELVWAKLIINVGINALTAILKIKNGRLNEIEEIKPIIKMAVFEAVEAAKAEGIDFNKDEEFEKVLSVALKTSENQSSMLQDVINRRKTEIDTINGAVVKVGERKGIPTPVNSTLWSLVKSIEKNY